MEKTLKTVSIGNGEVTVKEYAGKRVVTFKDIDNCHGRPEGTARKRFNDNKKHFLEGEDFFKITPSEFRTAFGSMDKRQQNDITLLTESGYLMLVKSFTDDLAWEVQRELVNRYFVQEDRQNSGIGEMQIAEIVKISVTAAVETVTKVLPAMIQCTVQTMPTKQETASFCENNNINQYKKFKVGIEDVACTSGKIEGFPKELRDEVNKILLEMKENQNVNFSAVARFCTANGYKISFMGVKRYYYRYFK